MPKNKLSPELTAKEHAELIGSEIPYSDLMVMAVWCDIDNGIDKQAALKKRGLSEQYYDENIVRVLNT